MVSTGPSFYFLPESRDLMSLRSIPQLLTYSAILIAVYAAPVSAETTLHERIDAALGAGNPQFENQAVATADDATFLRRITLDLTGTIPTAEKVRAFVADTSADKRVDEIDRLLASPEYARRMQYVFDTMLMERHPDKHVPAKDWQKYLRESFLANRRWDDLVQEMLTVDGTDEKTRPAAKFLLDRELKAEQVTRDLGRLFLGRDLQCAQCHDHPNVNDYLQRHYHGLNAFLSRSYLFRDPKTKKTSIGEKAEGQVAFTSVFTKEEGKTAPRVLDLPEIPDPEIPEEPYRVKPAKNVRSIPVYSRRLQLADAITSTENQAFQNNIVNRLWALMMGRGLVEPLDMWHSDNPPTHPEVLELLSTALQEMDYDLKYLIRELALTDVYQRSSRNNSDLKSADKPDYRVGLLKPLSPEQLAWSMMQATGVTERTLAGLKAKKIKDDPKHGPQVTAEPLWQEEALHDALWRNVDSFTVTFGTVGAQSSRFDASANQALFLLNGPLIQSWLVPGGNNLTARLKKLESGPAVAEELYLAVLSRFPNESETRQVVEYLNSSQQETHKGIPELVWAALVSDEFRFNH
ncbi:MAG TPA: hypothetical protein DCM07_26805 [Planctomycetaceae bacterium]|nr:hypothetical protein [Gimesia sp.]HAH48389.1 hypothetical protein [Planctomycetaceae bacterium]HBL44714.1 hypothetical protein [Planctomycetaceae bacterium]|tara:strand:+ start:37033 stop:38763 length:1731 start_codon:yes stop_codon:yes gene_type:complete